MIALLLVVVGFFLLGVDAADFSIGGLGLLAALIVALGLWVGGWFDRRVWFADEETAARCAEIDRELEEKGAVSAPVSTPVISLEVARAVLWHFGDTNLGIQPGQFVRRLLVLTASADEENFEKLRAGWPEHVAAFEAVARKPWGLDWLRGIVKADLDARDRGLDFTAVQP